MSLTLSKIAQLSKIYFRPKDVNYLILYVTSICNQKCEFCFYADSLNAEWGDGLSLEQMEKVSKSLPNCFQLTLTGGEPFIRKDLDQIVHAFCTHSNTLNLTFPTNGSLPDRIEAQLRKMLPAHPDCVFRIALSIDATEEKHDEIRGMKGAFKKAEETFKRVQALQKEFKNLVLVITTVASKYNKNNLRDFIDFATENLWCDDHSLLLARGNTKQEDAKDITPQEYSALVAYLEKKKKEKTQSKSLYKKLLKHIETRTREIVEETYLKDEYMMPCVAGKKLLVLYDSGDLTPCEILATLPYDEVTKKEFHHFVLGNVHEHDYDIGSILKTERAKKIRNHILDSRCYCTFECAIAANLTMNLKNTKHLI